MDKTWKRRWVKALRSGEYQQGTGTLCRFDPREGSLQFCCLGVLADIVDPDGWEMEDYEGNRTFSNAHWGETGDWQLPEGIAIETGFLDPPTMAKLVNLNDNSRYDFDQIADWIESHPNL